MKDTEPAAAAEPDTQQTAPVPTQPDTPAAPAAEQAPAPVAPATPAAPNSAGTIVLQWLTYAFWGWLIAALIWVMAVILMNFILQIDVSSVVPYAVAAAVVLLPIAFFTDFAYRKREPLKKAGGASVVMVIHAVLFALLGIGTLISAVFILLNMSISAEGSSDEQVVAVLTTAFAALLYAAAFLRTLNPFKSSKPLFIYSVAMAALSVLLLILAIAGPVVTSIATRNDKRIEAALPSVDRAIRDYVTDEKKLPASLDDVTPTNAAAQELIDSGDITYKIVDGTGKSSSRTTTYRYEICADFTAKSSRKLYQGDYSRNEYASYLNATSHGAGNHCFKLSVNSYQNSTTYDDY